MREPDFYPHRPGDVDVRETHISLVFLAGERAYKVKKELTLPFLDYGTLERRRFFCHEEVRLNRRLAPDTYLGVRSIVPSADRFSFAEPDDPRAIEYAVEMRRLSERSTLDRLVRSGAADDDTIETVTGRIVEFHREAERAPPGFGRPVDVKARLDENLATILPWVGTAVDRHAFAAVERFSSAFVLNRRDLLAQRVAGGRVREGHGDLRAEHIVVEDGRVSAYDCVEFDEGLRFIDVAADLAFLYMDLERLGASDLAARVERIYVEQSGDRELSLLLPFYACYRASVRAKIACLRLDQLGLGDARSRELLAEARSLSALADRFAWRSRLPLVLVLCGVAASGKSALAEEISRRSGLAHLSSDVIRKELAGIAPDERGGKEIYEAELSIRTYEELALRARALVGTAGGALLDATFTRRQYRRKLAERLQATGARLLFCECQAPAAVLRERAGVREQAPERGSDATWEVVQGQLERFERLDDVPARDHLALRTDRPIEEALDELESFVSRAVEGQPG
jgi:aminoglycoside phosphotransferase family enzyme/predicted kinase